MVRPTWPSTLTRPSAALTRPPALNTFLCSEQPNVYVVLNGVAPGPELPFWISQPRSGLLQMAYAVTSQVPFQPGATSAARTRHVLPSTGYDSVRKTLLDALPPISPPPPIT